MPAAPTAIFTPPATPTPGAPGAVHSAPAATPAAIGAVHVVAMVGGATGVNISGPLTSNGSLAVVFPTLIDAGVFNGKMHYTDTGVSKMDIGEGAWNYFASYEAILMVGNRWSLYQKSPAAQWLGPINGNESGPEMVASWSALGSATGTPVVSNGSSLAAPGAIHASPGIPTPAAPPAITP